MRREERLTRETAARWWALKLAGRANRKGENELRTKRWAWAA